MVVSHYILENREGIREMVSFMNLKFSEKFNVPAANNRIGDWINVRPGVSGRIVSMQHEHYDDVTKKMTSRVTTLPV
jgi:hypothetical protein